MILRRVELVSTELLCKLVTTSVKDHMILTCFFIGTTNERAADDLSNINNGAIILTLMALSAWIVNAKTCSFWACGLQ